MTLSELITRLKAIDVWQIAYDVVKRHEADIIRVQKEQFAAGLNLAGEQMSPSIPEDPFFKGNDKWARWWVRNKDQRQSEIFTERRPETVPNLIFSSGVEVWQDIHLINIGTDFMIGTNDLIQSDLEAKYGLLFGLTPQGVVWVAETFFNEEFCNEFKKQLGINN
ncbi:MAG: hypothetical protein LBK94_11255 [Prevotellaceae bacterium]|jgi:hypothetical protein|nr:hypothetical protein [Prevotellaceae bacterium]